MHAERDIVLPMQSVCPMPVLCQNEWTYRHTFSRSGSSIIRVFPALPRYKIPRETPSAGDDKCTGGNLPNIAI